MTKYTSVNSLGMPKTNKDEEEKQQDGKDPMMVNQVKHKKSMSVENVYNNDDGYMNEEELI